MNDPAARRRAEGHMRWRSSLAVGLAVAALLLLVGIWIVRDFGTGIRSDKGSVIYSGLGTQNTASFYLAGGTYRTHWSAWERGPEYPPCTHSAELMAVDHANATTPLGHVVDLARLVQVPPTGASVESYVINVKPGDYYFEISSECGWQIAIMSN
jgi:hypothetical protein